MITRRLENQLIKTINRSPSVVLNVAEPLLSLALEKRTDRLKISDIHSFHEANKDKLIILDEVQLAPEIFAEIRGIIDEQRRSGNKYKQFLFLGPASLDLLKQTSESLAGRIALLELHPIDIM